MITGTARLFLTATLFTSLCFLYAICSGGTSMTQNNGAAAQAVHDFAPKEALRPVSNARVSLANMLG